MNLFLQRLMDRSRPEALNPEVHQTVLPRLRSRFEPPADSGAFIPNDFYTHHLQNVQTGLSVEENAEPVVQETDSTRIASVKPHVPVYMQKHPAENSQAHESSLTRAERENGGTRIAPVQSIFKANQSNPEVFSDIGINQNTIQQHPGEARQPNDIADHTGDQDGALRDRLDQQVQSILYHLNHSQQPGAGDQGAIKTGFDFKLPLDHDPQATADPPQIDPLNRKPESDREFVESPNPQPKPHIGRKTNEPGLNHLKPQREYLRDNSDQPVQPKSSGSGIAPDGVQPGAREKRQDEVNQLEKRNAIPFPLGSLQIPGWLKDLQADLNARWQEINAQAATETVVNVTIGRVEVKAVQNFSAQQTRAPHKAKSALSLDDYLKKRGNGERR